MVNSSKIKREPLLRVTKRDTLPLWQSILVRAIAIVGALMAIAFFVYLTAGISPLEVYSTMWEGAFGNEIYVWSTLVFTAKLLCIAVALAPAFKMRFWNIGAEGQLLAGALATAMVMIRYGDTMAPWLLYLTMAVAAGAAGALWGIIPAFFKAHWNTNETLFTLMMNYVAIQLVAYYCNLWKGTASTLGKLNKATRAGWFPVINGHKDMINLFVVLAFAVAMFFYLKKSKHGYEIAVVGESQNTACYAGINVKKVIVRTMALSGMICGICGLLTVAGQNQTVSIATGGGYGFTAIIVAWMSKMNTFCMIAISLFVVALEEGTKLIASNYSSFSDSAGSIVIGIILFFIIGCEFFVNYRLHIRKKSTKEDK